MSIEHQTVVILGATGVVGSGVVRAYLNQGATVVGVSRSADKLNQLKQQLDIKDSEPFLGVVGDFTDEPTAESTQHAVATALAGKPIDHVVSILGFVNYSKAPTEAPLSDLKGALADGLYNTFLASKVFLPQIKERDGATYTLVSGGLAHMQPPMPALWLATVKNAALNALTLALAGETANSKVRVNTLCIHFGVAPVGGNKNQFGMPAESDTLRLGPAFVGLTRGTQKGQVICLSSFADGDKLAAQ